MYVPSVDGAKTIFANDFALFNKGYVKSMADAVGKNSLLCVPHESHRRIRRLLSEPFSMNSLSKFVQKIDCMLSKRLEKLERDGQSFVVLDFNMKVLLNSISIICCIDTVLIGIKTNGRLDQLSFRNLFFLF